MQGPRVAALAVEEAAVTRYPCSLSTEPQSRCAFLHWNYPIVLRYSCGFAVESGVENRGNLWGELASCFTAKEGTGLVLVLPKHG